MTHRGLAYQGGGVSTPGVAQSSGGEATGERRGQARWGSWEAVARGADGEERRGEGG
jgi:hypothetical protein